MSVEIADVDCIHINYVNVLEASQCQIGQDLATQTASADNQNLGLISQKVFYLDAGEDEIEILKQTEITYTIASKECRIRSRTGSVQDLIYVIVSTRPVCRRCSHLTLVLQWSRSESK